MCSHTTMYVPILLHMFPDINIYIYVLMLLYYYIYMSSCCYVCAHVSSCCGSCCGSCCRYGAPRPCHRFHRLNLWFLVLLNVSAYFYMCVLILLYSISHRLYTLRIPLATERPPPFLRSIVVPGGRGVSRLGEGARID